MRLIPNVLRGVEGRTITRPLFDRLYDAPFGIAPMGISSLMALDGDVVLARAAKDAGIPFILSGSSLTPLERVLESNPDTWFQAYLPGEEDRIRALVQRVDRAGYKTLVLTADTAVLANRENNLRAGFSTPLRITPRLIFDLRSNHDGFRNLSKKSRRARDAAFREFLCRTRCADRLQKCGP